MPVVSEKFKAKKEPNKAKQYLMQIRWIDEEVERDKNEIMRLTALAEGIKGITYDKDKVQSSPADHMADAVAKLVDYKAKMVADSVKLVELEDKIRKQIADMPDPIHRQILARYYIDGQRFEAIAIGLSYSYQYIINTHGRALQAFEKLYLTE